MVTTTRVELRLLLAAVAFTVKHAGRYVGKVEARARGTSPTSTLAELLLDRLAHDDLWTVEDIAAFDSQIDSWKDQGDAAILWASNIKPENEYERNIRKIARDGFFLRRGKRSEVALAASIWSAFMRAQSVDVRRSLENLNEFWGTPGAREELVLVVTRKTSHETQYGTTVRLELRDAEGRMFVWWCSRASAVEEIGIGGTVRLKASIKEHKDWNGVKQTVLTRCKIVEAG